MSANRIASTQYKAGSLIALLSAAASFFLTCNARCQEPEPGKSAFEIAEGDFSGSAMVQLRGRNVSDDWVGLVKQLQRDGDGVPVSLVSPPPNGGLCQTYVAELNLPGCSDAVLNLAKTYNPNIGSIIRSDAKIAVPVLPLHEAQWTVVLDQEIPEDQKKLADFVSRWQVLDRQERDSQVRLTFRAYDVYLPKETAVYFPPAFDNAVGDLVIQKRVVSDPGNILDKLFGMKPRAYFEKCKAPEFKASEPVPYSQLLDDTELPACTRSCTGNNCPQINLFDTKLFLHPDIRQAVIEGGEAGMAPPAQPTRALCPSTDFQLNEHHATMLAGIMVGQPDGKAQFIGLAPGARVRSFVESSIPDQKRWAAQIEKLALKMWDTPQLFVFAGQFKYDSRHIEAGGLKTEDVRLAHPDVIPAIQNNRLIWITAAGQNENSPGHQLTPSRPESPMNLGDQRTIIVVTSCEKCSGEDASLWPNAHFSKLEDGLVNLAAPGGSDGDPIPAAANGFQYSGAYGTSQATAFVGGLAAAMVSCFPERYKADGRWLKTRLQVTADPLPGEEDATKVTGGIVNLKRSLLDPAANWIERGRGFEKLTDVSWCKPKLQLNEVASTADGTATIDVSKAAAILRFHDRREDKVAQWQIADADPKSAVVRWSGAGIWADNEPILTGTVGEGDNATKVSFTGNEIISFIPNARFDEIGVTTCDPGRP